MRVPIFPDTEAEMVAGLKLRLNKLEDYKNLNIRVATSKATAQVSPQPDIQVIVNTDGGPVINLLKEERLRVLIFAQNKSTANKISNLMAAVLETMYTEHIKDVSVSAGPYDVDYEGKEYQRYIAVEALVSADNFDIDI